MFSREQRRYVMRVSDVMTKQVACVRAEDRASAAAQIMWECDCGAVPVVGQGDRIVAVVTDRDICMATFFHDASPSAISVSQAMSKELHFCSPEDSVATAEQLMRAHQIRRLPVLDGEGRLVGVLSLADIARLGHRDKGRQRELAPDQITATLAGICTPREHSAPSTIQA